MRKIKQHNYGSQKNNFGDEHMSIIITYAPIVFLCVNYAHFINKVFDFYTVNAHVRNIIIMHAFKYFERFPLQTIYNYFRNTYIVTLVFNISFVVHSFC